MLCGLVGVAWHHAHGCSLGAKLGFGVCNVHMHAATHHLSVQVHVHSVLKQKSSGPSQAEASSELR